MKNRDPVHQPARLGKDIPLLLPLNYSERATWNITLTHTHTHLTHTHTHKHTNWNSPVNQPKGENSRSVSTGGRASWMACFPIWSQAASRGRYFTSDFTKPSTVFWNCCRSELSWGKREKHRTIWTRSSRCDCCILNTDVFCNSTPPSMLGSKRRVQPTLSWCTMPM